MRTLPRRLFVFFLATLALAACQKPQRADTSPGQQPAGAGADKDRPSPHIERITLASGLVIEDLQIGSGDVCLPDSKIRVRYTCHFPDGTFADSSGDDSRELELARMIHGWRDGLPGMRVGGRRRLTVPPDLGYGSRSVKDAKGVEVIPPGSTLIYEIDLLGLVPTTPSTTPASPPTIPESPATSHGG